jgi:hypothetical protein
MKTILDELKVLRSCCVSVLQRIDAILPQCEEWTATEGGNLPLVVEGRCEVISRHAIDRFRERTGTNKPDEVIVKRVAARLAIADEMELKPKYRVLELMAHGVHSKYWRSHDLIFVIESGVIVTVHRGEAERWTLKHA